MNLTVWNCVVSPELQRCADRHFRKYSQTHETGSANMSENRQRYKWPWVALAFLVLGIVLAVVWMSKEARRVRDLNTTTTHGLK